MVQQTQPKQKEHVCFHFASGVLDGFGGNAFVFPLHIRGSHENAFVFPFDIWVFGGNAYVFPSDIRGSSGNAFVFPLCIGLCFFCVSYKICKFTETIVFNMCFLLQDGNAIVFPAYTH